MIDKRIRQLRKEKGVNQEEFAKYLGITTSAVGMYEIGIRKPSFEVLVKIADYFNVSLDYLFGRDISKKKFIGSNLTLLRGNKTYEEYAEYLTQKGGGIITINPEFIKQYEKGIEKPSEAVLKYIADVESVDLDYFYIYNDQAAMLAEQEIIEHDHLSFMEAEVKEWVKNPKNYVFIQLAYQVHKKSKEKNKG